MYSEEYKRWIKSFTISFSVFLIFSLYLFLRRGYYNLYIINKVFGSAAVILAGGTLLIGPLAKKFKNVSKLMTIRRQLGLCAFGLALAHTVASLAQQQRFPFPKWYQAELIPVIAGILAIIVWSYMTYISRNEKIKELGVEVWKKRLSIAGRLGFLAIFTHLVIMKYQGWINWVSGKVKASPELANPTYPPASMFVFLFMFGVILYRVINYFLHKKSGGK